MASGGVYRRRPHPQRLRRWLGTFSGDPNYQRSDAASLASSASLGVTATLTESATLADQHSKDVSDGASLSEGTPAIAISATEGAALTDGVTERVLPAFEGLAALSSVSAKILSGHADGAALAEARSLSERLIGFPRVFVEAAFHTDPLVPQPNFLRNSDAWFPDGSALVTVNQPRHSPPDAGRYGRSVLFEEATTNLLSINQSGVETDLAGFGAQAGATLTRITTQAWQGTASAKVDTPGVVVEEGVSVGTHAVSPSVAYTWSAWVRGNAGDRLRLLVNTYTSADVLVSTFRGAEVTATGNWQRLTLTFTSDPTAAKAQPFVLTSQTPPAQAAIFHVDGLALEQRNHPTSWHPGGSTRVGEVLKLPAQVFSAGQGTIEAWVQVNAALRTQGHYHTVFLVERLAAAATKIGLWAGHDTASANLSVQSRDDGDAISQVSIADADLTDGFHHLAVRWSAAELKVFWDGVAKGTVANPKLAGALSTGWLGAGPTAAGTSFDNPCSAHCDDLRVSDIARSDAEIAATAASASPAPVDRNTTYKVPLESPIEYSWTDLSAFVRAFECSRGLEWEEDRVEAGTAKVTLDNSDRRFDPDHSGGPYFPDVVPGRRLRIRAEDPVTLITHPIFSGFTEAWPNEWRAGGRDALARAECADAFKLLAGAEISAWEREVLADDPEGWWRFEETSGATASDSSGNKTGTIQGGVTLGQPGGLHGPDRAFRFNGSTGYVDVVRRRRLASFDDWAIEAWINVDSTGSGRRTIAASTHSVDDWDVAWALHVENGHRLMFRHGRAPGKTWESPQVQLEADTWLLVAAVRDVARGVVELYVQGELAATASYRHLPTSAAQKELDIGRHRAGAKWYFKGLIGEVACYRRLSAGRVRSHYQSPITLPEQASGARLGLVLDLVDWPAAERAIATGQATVIRDTEVATEVLDYLRTVASTEQGALFVAADGKITFRNRDWRTQSSQDSLATFGDAATELGYRDIALAYDDSQVWTIIEIPRVGARAQEASDPEAIRRFGRRRRRLLGRRQRRQRRQGGLWRNDQEALDAGFFFLARVKEPALRVERIQLTGRANPSVWAHAFGRELGDRITVKRRPPGGGLPISQEVFVEHIAHRVSADPLSWDTDWELSLAQAQAFWLLGDPVNSVLGTTTRLAY